MNSPGRNSPSAAPSNWAISCSTSSATRAGARARAGNIRPIRRSSKRLPCEGAEIAQKVLDWRQLAKLKSTYTDALQAAINPDTGRVHTSYSLVGAQTGRLSSTDPNLQNIPIRTAIGRQIREAFVPEDGNGAARGRLFADRTAARRAHGRRADAEGGVSAAGEDIHARTAREMFGTVDRDTRARAKTINFAILYGISRWGLAGRLGVEPDEAQAMIDTYFQRFPGIQAYIHTTLETVRERGYSETLFGRKTWFPRITSKNQAERQGSERAAINAPIQGTSADIIKRAMVRMMPALEEAGLGHVRMLLQVHDELVFELPEGDVAAASAGDRAGDGRSGAAGGRTDCPARHRDRPRQELGRRALDVQERRRVEPVGPGPIPASHDRNDRQAGCQLRTLGVDHDRRCGRRGARRRARAAGAPGAVRPAAPSGEPQRHPERRHHRRIDGAADSLGDGHARLRARRARGPGAANRLGQVRRAGHAVAARLDRLQPGQGLCQGADDPRADRRGPGRHPQPANAHCNTLAHRAAGHRHRHGGSGLARCSGRARYRHYAAGFGWARRAGRGRRSTASAQVAHRRAADGALPSRCASAIWWWSTGTPGGSKKFA